MNNLAIGILSQDKLKNVGDAAHRRGFLTPYWLKRPSGKCSDYCLLIPYEVIGAAIEVHRVLGPGLLEEVYELCMLHELELRDIQAKRQHRVVIDYKGKIMETELRCDLLVEDCLVVELKSVAVLLPIFEAQAMTYSRLLKVPKAVLINFNCKNIFHEGQKTFVNDFFRDLPDE